MSKEVLIEAIEPICTRIGSLDLNDANCKEILANEFPLEDLGHIRSLVEQGIQEGWLCPRGKAPMT